MKILTVRGYHLSVSDKLMKDSLDRNKLKGAPYGGYGLYIKSNNENFQGIRLYYVKARGLTLDLLNQEDINYFVERQDAFLKEKNIEVLYDSQMIQFYDEFVKIKGIQILIMNPETTVIKDLECITKLTLIKSNIEKYCI